VQGDDWTARRSLVDRVGDGSLSDGALVKREFMLGRATDGEE
jgi:hypothetical protein